MFFKQPAVFLPALSFNACEAFPSFNGNRYLHQLSCLIIVCVSGCCNLDCHSKFFAFLHRDRSGFGIHCDFTIFALLFKGNRAFFLLIVKALVCLIVVFFFERAETAFFAFTAIGFAAFFTVILMVFDAW